LAGLNRPALAFSPNGKGLVYVARQGNSSQQLYLQAINSQEAHPIPGTEGARDPFFSPDGQWIGFFADGKLKKVSASSGATPVNLSDASNPRGGTWGPEDTIIFPAFTDSGLFQISAAGGSAQALTEPDRKKGESLHGWPEFLPDGKTILYTIATAGGTQIVAQSLETGQRRLLIEVTRDTNVHYVATGHLAYVQAGTLMVVPFDPARLEVTGDPAPVVEGIMQATDMASAGAAQFTFSKLGRLVYIPGGLQGVDRRLVWVSREGVVEPLPAPPGAYSRHRLSPDGRRVLVQIEEATGESALWLYDIPDNEFTKLAFQAHRPIWTPDGNRITFHKSAELGGPANMFLMDIDGSGTEEQLLTSPYEQTPHAWSPDGRVLAFVENNPTVGTGSDIWMLPFEGERKPQLFLRTPSFEGGPSFSPDGRWVAYVSTVSGQYEVYVKPYPGPGRERQISTEGGGEPVWARTGELFYRNGDKMMVVETKTQPDFSAEKPRLLFQGRYVLYRARANYDVSPDVERFLMVKPSDQELAPVTQLSVVENWFEELKRRSPSAEDR
jgi:serine/threonine-protein kinase